MIKPTPKKAGHFRCKTCNSTRSRVMRLAKKRAGITEGFAELKDKESRKSFYKECALLFDDQLAKRVDEILEQKSVQTAKLSFKGQGKWLDKEDLEAKYRGKPQQLESIYEHANCFEHPTRKVKPMLDCHTFLA